MYTSYAGHDTRRTLSKAFWIVARTLDLDGERPAFDRSFPNGGRSQRPGITAVVQVHAYNLGRRLLSDWWAGEVATYSVGAVGQSSQEDAAHQGI